jgi:bloom syndrome protein
MKTGAGEKPSKKAPVIV